ncbi:sec-independent protein translocase protein TatA [Paenibacillus sp. PastF-1]|uniref:Twin-arginine translocase TatA/TatE family subunit n=2 Tax=Paenibacillus TaxID=44249 RepID=A0ABX7LI92_9BACL|nr:sec-independent protein translocase protein TatA [Paenibacillus sp. PastF-2]MDF9846211.1 sec-independent protein translocase protein TatA [Paenibacillus sp. PastM-2]MDF9852783.1 sec-independent protein translocase protein TatA [Paenibacillus sp. PastF-1]MDH6477487.1 sec-independent protein translocase protein TatA [Paenibacillus sp. PastH-2]QSF47767.1 twin-arginine translocase TatA/TatE family subunit [Paenibacillus tianjinensis]
MPMNIGVAGMILLVILGLLLFGPSKLPQLGRAIGTTLSEFKRGAKGLVESEEKTENNKDVL